MKRIFAFSLALILAVSLGACSGGNSEGTSPSTSSAAPEAAATTAFRAKPTLTGNRLVHGDYSIMVPGGWSDTSGNKLALVRNADKASLSVEAVSGELYAVAAEKTMLFNFYKDQYSFAGGLFNEGKTDLAGSEALYYECYISKQITKNAIISMTYYFIAHGDKVYCVTVYSDSANLSGDAEILAIVDSIEFI